MPQRMVHGTAHGCQPASSGKGIGSLDSAAVELLFSVSQRAEGCRLVGEAEDMGAGVAAEAGGGDKSVLWPARCMINEEAVACFVIVI